MLAAFLHFEEEVVLVIGLTPKDFALLAGGAPAPTIDIESLAAEADCPAATRIEVVFGVSEEAINERIQTALGSTSTGMRELTGGSSLEEQYVRQDSPSPAGMAASAAEELAIKRAKAKLN